MREFTHGEAARFAALRVGAYPSAMSHLLSALDLPGA